MDPNEVRDWLSVQPGVEGLHDLHIWPISTKETALTAHLLMSELPESDEFLQQLALQLQERFKISHATFQIERGDDRHPCKQSQNCAK
jgi:cobalt-zinc-cadmium efflux system protein